MKICLLNGMENDNYVEDILVNIIGSEDLNHLKLREMNIEYCKSCDGCSKLGYCVQQDEGKYIIEGYKESDIIVLITPIKYGAYSKELKKAIDRTMPIGGQKLLVKEGYMIHQIKYNNKKVVVIGVLARENKEAEESFSSLVKANYYNMDWKSYKQCIIYKNMTEEEIECKIESVFREAMVYE